MAKLLQLRGGTTSQHSSFTGAVREVTVDTDKDTLVVHDGSTQGGFALPRTNAEIRALVEAASDSNVFTDADHSKLNAIEASADVTDATNVTAAGALMDSECTSLADVKALNQSVTSGASPTFVTLNATTVDLGNWTITESSGVLYFATSGTNKMKLEANGNLTVTGDVTAYGSV